MSSDFVIRFGLCQLQLLKGDITKIAVDAIVNAANSQLAGGGGVDGAIHSAGGPEIMAELDEVRERIGRCETGSAVVTSAGRLPAKYVFHAVGPRYRDGRHGEVKLLSSCYTTCLNLAAERGVKTISFPSISTGIYGYPIARGGGNRVENDRRLAPGTRRPGARGEIRAIQSSRPRHLSLFRGKFAWRPGG